MSVKSVVTHILASQEDIAAGEERADAELHGARTSCKLAQLRAPAVLSGVVKALVLRPRNGVPALEADLYDGSGSVRLVWLGRRQIAGIEPGRRMKVDGFVSLVNGRPTIFNPRYELRAKPGE